METGQLTVTELAPRIRELQEKRELLNRAQGELQATLSEGQVEQVGWETFIQSIDKLESEVVLCYSLPLPPETISENRPGVLDIVQSGGAQRSNVLSKRFGQEAGGMPRCGRLK